MDSWKLYEYAPTEAVFLPDNSDSGLTHGEANRLIEKTGSHIRNQTPNTTTRLCRRIGTFFDYAPPTLFAAQNNCLSG